MLRIGVIGLGNRMASVLGSMLSWDMGADIVAVADPDESGARSRMHEKNIPLQGVQFFKEAQDMLSGNLSLDGVMIGTRCNFHALLCDFVVRQNIPLFLEKPVFTNDQEALLLKQLLIDKPNAKVVVSFPLRVTPLAQAAHKIIQRGELGVLSQAVALNNVHYARGYFKKWYRDEHITGGLFLQKATHDLDLLSYLIDDHPIMVAAMSTHRIMKGDHPVGLRCHECAEKYSCPESTWVLKHCFNETDQPDTCSFAVDTGNEDSGSVLLQYATGLHGSYTQNFIVRKAGARRSVRVIGFKATLDLDFYNNVIQVFHHQQDRTDTIQFTEDNNHYGGDRTLSRTFLDLLYGKATTYPSLFDGYISALTCLRAKQSAQKMRFLKVE